MIKIITSNIRFDNPRDGLNAWPNRIGLMSKTYQGISPDLIGTQEGREPQLRELEKLLGYKIADNNRDWIDVRMYPSLFTHKNLKTFSSGDIWLSNTPNIAGSRSFGSAFPRVATWIKVFKEDYFYIFNVHLDHMKSSTRIEQARVLKEQIRIINDKNLPFIVMGDFNSGPASRVYKFLLYSLNLVDPWKEAKLKEETSFHMFKGIYPKGRRIDWILHSKHFSANSIELIKTNENGIYISDHFPVYCELEVK